MAEKRYPSRKKPIAEVDDTSSENSNSRKKQKGSKSTETEVPADETTELGYNPQEEISKNKLNKKGISELQKICRALAISPVPTKKGELVSTICKFYQNQAKARFSQEKNAALDLFLAQNPIPQPNRDADENPKLDIQILRCDPVRPYIYGLSSGKNLSYDSFLFVFDQTNGKLLHKIPVGFNATGMDFAYPNKEALYVTNCGLTPEALPYIARDEFYEYLRSKGFVFQVRRVNLSDFSVSAIPINAGTDIFNISCADGALIIEGKDQWVDLAIYELEDRTTNKTFTGVRSGFGAVSSDGKCYYHISHDSSAGNIAKYDILRQEGKTTLCQVVQHGINFGFPKLVASGNFERIYAWPSAGLPGDNEHDWYVKESNIYNNNLEVVGTLDEEILAANFKGDIVVSNEKIMFLKDDRVERSLPLPFSCQVMCLDSATPPNVWLYNTQNDAVEKHPITVE